MISSLLNQAQTELHQLETAHRRISERNSELFKILATVKNDLEKTLKSPETLHETVYRCIDLLRANTPYYSTNDQKTKTDPPLTQEQKTLK